MKKRYVITRGPVQPPFSLYGQRSPLQAGETLDSEDNPWLRGCLRDGRLAPVASKKRKGAKADD